MKKGRFLFGIAVLIAQACAGPVSPQDKLCVNDEKINALIAQMTLEEKVNMLHSKTNMSSAGVERLGIADMHYADGPFGIREEGQPNGFMSAGWTLDSATYFPTGSALAATWSEELAYKYGTGMGKEARLRGKDVILGPAVNIQRLPVGGRTYEYLSEDPILSAALALEYTKGCQDQGTAVCIKHFAVNNQETNRGSVDAQIDERTLREIYLKPFERAIIEGGAIKGNLQLSHIPVVLVTAKVAVENQIQGLDKGADAYVTKPFQPAYLLALVKSLLDNREKLHRQLGSVTTTEDIAPEALTPRDATFMKELYELMEKELSNADLDIVRMTEMMKISRTKFYYKVKGLTGENPSVFFKRYKLNRAADLLKEGKHNMSEIAWMTGFNTLSHFSTSFKKQFGVPPSEYSG